MGNPSETEAWLLGMDHLAGGPALTLLHGDLRHTGCLTSLCLSLPFCTMETTALISPSYCL